jgi:hypothetical protein
MRFLSFVFLTSESKCEAFVKDRKKSGIIKSVYHLLSVNFVATELYEFKGQMESAIQVLQLQLQALHGTQLTAIKDSVSQTRQALAKQMDDGFNEMIDLQQDIKDLVKEEFRQNEAELHKIHKSVTEGNFKLGSQLACFSEDVQS